MLRVGIVGFGFMGRAHLEAYQKLPDAEVVAIATRNLKISPLKGFTILYCLLHQSDQYKREKS